MGFPFKIDRNEYKVELHLPSAIRTIVRVLSVSYSGFTYAIVPGISKSNG